MIITLFKAHPVYTDEEIGLFWQKKIFKYLFSALLIIGIIPYSLSCLHALKMSQWHLAVIFTLFYIWGICITLIEKIHFPLRVWGGLAAIYFLGITSLLTSGFFGSARLYLLCFCAFAAIFSTLRGALFASGVSISTMLVFGFMFDAGILLPDQMKTIFTLDQWLVYTGTFAFLCAAITIPLAFLIRAIDINGKEFQHLIKNTSEMIWAMDPDQNISFVNASVTHLFGHGADDWIGMPLNRFLNESDSKMLKKKLQAEESFCMEATILKKDGTPVPVEITGSRMRHFSDSAPRYQGIIRDITEQQRQRDQEKMLKKKLKEAEKISSLGVLAGSVAHDLNNILSGIATYPEVLLMDSDLDPEVERGLEIIKDSGQKASAVVSDLLTITRGSRAEKDILNINSLLERYSRAHDFMKIQKSYPDVTIELMTEPELLNILGSYIHIEKSVMNLVLNAAEAASENRDGQVTISTSNAFLDSSLPGFEHRTPGEYVILSVADNGPGISDEDQGKIFEPFYTRKTMGKSGTGLGLSVVWNAVRDHDGYIDVVSSGNGTRFDLIFPATRQDIPEKPKEGSFDEIKGQGETILVVDDLESQQDIALSILTHLGYNAQAVSNGFDAVDFIKDTPTDLVILDMIMEPSISGLETYRMIKEINPGQKAIIASGYAESEDVQTARHLGAGSFVKKPYTILDMGIAVKEELEK
jgi:two-component system cell cycle sensor histidine kinase/response regulator CckA